MATIVNQFDVVRGLVRPYAWPLVAIMLLLFVLVPLARRRGMFMEGRGYSATGNFSFFVGRKHIVSLGGLDGRKTFFESKNLSVSQGAIELLAGLVSTNDDREDYGAQDFIKSFLTLTRPEILARKLPVLTDDIHDFRQRLSLAPASPANPQWRVINPFETVYPLMFKLILRVVGVSEWLEDAKALDRALWAFCGFESNCSRTRIVFPSLVTLTHAKKLFFGAILYMAIEKVVKQRKAGKRRDDALQFLLDQDKDVVRFLFSVLMSGITTQGCTASWLTVFLAHSPAWQALCRAEVDAVVAKHRANPSQSADDVLEGLSLQTWESEFPVTIASFRETIRLAMPGAMFRKNASGTAIPIGDTGEVVPDGSYASFHLDNVHMDSALYPDPAAFNPGRYLSREVGGSYDDLNLKQEEPHTYVGWGSGRHLCPGMRLAKWETTMVVSRLLANFDLEPSDRSGSKVQVPFPGPDRNGYRLDKPKVPIFIRYKARDVGGSVGE
ncbi:cytochrome P450 [Lasiosphaeria miniovina]|uniref:Cytochrome P450 n=1 Tax=Lasiosphaeria miniovina TaxID=1954250 RepID=A0AA40B4Y5_9PEZI|nr:cytochrome P450 [Lasiosphaeria miniovina]KAK0727678.1 cytochrome P450 [Lasiosphaeria miniovina]